MIKNNYLKVLLIHKHVGWHILEERDKLINFVPKYFSRNIKTSFTQSSIPAITAIKLKDIKTRLNNGFLIELSQNRAGYINEKSLIFFSGIHPVLRQEFIKLAHLGIRDSIEDIFHTTEIFHLMLLQVSNKA